MASPPRSLLPPLPTGSMPCLLPGAGGKSSVTEEGVFVTVKREVADGHGDFSYESTDLDTHYSPGSLM